MIITKLLGLGASPVKKILNGLGAILNQCPGKEELNQLKQSPLFKTSYPKKKKETSVQKNQPNHKKDHKPKGSVNTDSQIFNKPRK